MFLLLAAMGILLLSGVAALFASRVPRAASWIGAGGAALGCALGLVPAIHALASKTTETLHVPWSIPYGSFSVGIDALSAFFLIPIFVLSGLCAIYGAGYLRQYEGKKALGPPWFFFNILVASMAGVVAARNAVLFLVAWEIMMVSAYFLVAFENEKKHVREAAWTYLVATHLGTAFLLPMFVLLGSGSGSLDFDTFVNERSASHAGVLFLMAVIGFGTKAGFMPFHVWLPEAHPVAPSHVSAIMSGVLLKTGIYGLARTLLFLGSPPLWWGLLLVAIGVTSGVLGVLFALAQHELKRLLAYHSVENIGIIATGLGIGLLGVHSHSVPVAVLGFGGGILHVLNHTLFKGLLFLGAGAVGHGAHSLEIDHLGGLLKAMPWTAATFFAGAVAISGLPPFNGFISEFLIYFGAFRGGSILPAAPALAMFAAIFGLALIGGLATACFTKAFGAVFLGHARSEHAAHAHEAGAAMVLPMLALAGLCLLIGLCAPLVVAALEPVVVQMTGFPKDVIAASFSDAALPLKSITWCALAFLALAGALAALRYRLLRRHGQKQALTWDCGYAKPTARMQYTASSFAQPLTAQFKSVLRTRYKRLLPERAFPREAALSSDTPDLCMHWLYLPIFDGARWLFSKLRWLQHGRVQLYVLYVALTLLILLVWKLG